MTKQVQRKENLRNEIFTVWWWEGGKAAKIQVRLMSTRQTTRNKQTIDFGKIISNKFHRTKSFLGPNLLCKQTKVADGPWVWVYKKMP